MFEYDQEIVNALLSEDVNFKRLYEKHNDLKRRVHEANIGALAMDDFSLENLKKEKLFLKDQMAGIIESYRRTHA
ncbi:MAG: YdcH family protein [Gammaproteobacteria bacterium]